MRQYADAGLDMMFEHATHEDGGISVEAGVAELHDRMRGGRFKIFRDGNDDFIEEMALYHRKDGLLVKENDDAISCSEVCPDDEAPGPDRTRQGIVQSRNPSIPTKGSY